MRYAVDIVDELEKVCNLMNTDLNKAKDGLQDIINSIYTESMKGFE